MSQQASIKKVKPFPFSGEIKDRATAKACQIVALTQAAILLETRSTALQPGEHAEVSFVLPVTKGHVKFDAVVVKVTSQLAQLSPESSSAASSAAPVAIQRIELQIRTIEPTSTSHIADFLRMISQSKGS